MEFTLCSLNCNGLRAADARGFGRWLKRRRPDVLCLQELRAWPDQVKPELRAPAGYNARWTTADRRGYSGVAVYSRGPADRYVSGSGLDWGDAEGRILRADFGELSVLSTYLPSGSSGPARQQAKMEFLEHFADVARALVAENRPIALCGDLNVAHRPIDIHDPRGNAKSSGFLPEERAWLDRLLAAGWVDVFRELHPDEAGVYSWWSNRGRARELDRGWRIDYVLATPALAELAREAWIERRAGLSDHAPVWVRFAWPEGETPPLGTTSRV